LRRLYCTASDIYYLLAFYGSLSSLPCSQQPLRPSVPLTIHVKTDNRCSQAQKVVLVFSIHATYFDIIEFPHAVDT